MREVATERGGLAEGRKVGPMMDGIAGEAVASCGLMCENVETGVEGKLVETRAVGRSADAGLKGEKWSKQSMVERACALG